MLPIRKRKNRGWDNSHPRQASGPVLFGMGPVAFTKMPYTQFRRNGKYCIRNRKTGNVTCFDSEETRDKMIRIREAFAHGFKPKGLASASKTTRKRVSSMGGKARRKR